MKRHLKKLLSNGLCNRFFKDIFIIFLNLLKKRKKSEEFLRWKKLCNILCPSSQPTNHCLFVSTIFWIMNLQWDHPQLLNSILVLLYRYISTLHHLELPVFLEICCLELVSCMLSVSFILFLESQRQYKDFADRKVWKSKKSKLVLVFLHVLDLDTILVLFIYNKIKGKRLM